MKRLSWKYIAGLIDGEGCLDVQVTNGIYVRPRVRIGMTKSSLFVLEILKENHGGFLSYRETNNEKWEDSVCWELVGYSQVCSFLRNIVNHLLIKQEQARLLLWLETGVKGQQVTDEVRQLIRDELKAMKRDPHRLSEKAQEKIKSLL
jgi:hypothetical protein